MFSNWEFFQFHQITFFKFNFGLDDVTKGWHSVTVVQSKLVNFSICLKDIFVFIISDRRDDSAYSRGI